MSPSGRNHSSPAPQEENPGAYPIPFGTRDVELGSRLDSIPAPLRYWAVDRKRAHNRWYDDMVQANARYEEWLCTQLAEDYPLPFHSDEGTTIGEISDRLRYWAADGCRSDSRWYNNFVRANARYEQHLTVTREPGDFPFPWGEFKGKPIKDVPQGVIWSALRSSNSDQNWYPALYEANKRFLDGVYDSRSPGSEPIWFGKRYRGLRLDQVYERKRYLRWCFDPQRGEHGWNCRLKDLVRRLEEWRLAHPERSSPRKRRKTRDIQNPVGEAVGPWDDSAGSAAEEDEYERDSFVQSDNDEVELTGDELSDSSETLSDDSGSDNDNTRDSDGSGNSSTHPARYTHKRRRVNIIVSDEEEVEDVGASVNRLGRNYRVPNESSDDEDVPARKSSKRMR